MKHAINPLYPWTPDLSIVSPDNTCSVDSALFEALQENPSVKKVYGRRFAYNIPALINDKPSTADIISYEEAQFEWAKEYNIEGSLEEVENRRNTGLVVFTPQYGQQTTIQVGDIVTLDIDGQPAEIEIAGMISKCPFDSSTGSEIIICSEDTFQALTGVSDYTILDIQLTRNATDNAVNAIHAAAGTGYTFSDRRMNNDSVRGASYSFGLFLYGFLTLIGLIAIFNIINCMSMNVIARMKQYGALRAIGLSNRQLSKMIIAQTLTYVFAGSVCGGVLGLTLNKILFERLVTFRWGDHWQIPITELGIITVIVIVSVVLAIRSPLKKIEKMSIVDTISAL